MTLAELKSLSWTKWLQRDFKPFMISLFKNSTNKKYYDVICSPPMNAMLYQNGFFYESPEVWKEFATKLSNSQKSIFDATISLKMFHKNSVKTIKKLKNSDPPTSLSEFYELISVNVAYIWLAHGWEEYYNLKSLQEVPKYVQENVNQFIGDASFPTKKNAHASIENAIPKRNDPEKIPKKFG